MWNFKQLINLGRSEFLLLLGWCLLRLGLIHDFRLSPLPRLEFLNHLFLLLLCLFEFSALFLPLSLFLLPLFFFALFFFLLFLFLCLLYFALDLLQLFFLFFGFLLLFLNAWLLACFLGLLIFLFTLGKLFNLSFQFPISFFFSLFLLSQPICFILFFFILLFFFSLSLSGIIIHRCFDLTIEVCKFSFLNLSQSSPLLLFLSFASKDWIFVFYVYFVMVQLNCLDDICQCRCCFFGSSPIFHWKFGNFFLQRDRDMSQLDGLGQFMPFQMINIRPSSRNLLLFGKGLNNMKFKCLKKHLIQYFIDFLIICTHSLQVYLIVIWYLCFSNLLITLRQNVVWVLKELVIEDFYCLGLSGVVTCLWGGK